MKTNEVFNQKFNISQIDLKVISVIVDNVNNDNIVDVKIFFEYLKDHFTSPQIIKMFKVGTSSYYDFYSNYKKGKIIQNKFYSKMRELFYIILFEESEK